MAVRDSINNNQRIGYGVAAGVIIIGLGIVGYQLMAGRQTGITVAREAYYTDDNGKTFFKAAIYQVSPFDHNGKQAYRADVFQCPDGKQFVGLMYRHNAYGRKAMSDHIAKGAKDPKGALLASLEIQGTDVKPAGAPDTAWRPNSGDNERSVKCPSGGVAQFVTP